MRKDVRALIRRPEAAGLTVESTPGHYCVLRDGKPLRRERDAVHAAVLSDTTPCGGQRTSSCASPHPRNSRASPVSLAPKRSSTPPCRPGGQARLPRTWHGKTAWASRLLRHSAIPSRREAGIPRTSRSACQHRHDSSRGDPARGSRKLRHVPANPRNGSGGKPCSQGKSTRIPA